MSTLARTIQTLTLGLVVAFGAACTAPVETEEPSAQSSFAAEVRNGITLNGMTNNGVTNNGVTNNGITNNGIFFNGITNNGVTNNGVTNNGTQLKDVYLKGSEIRAVTKKNKTLTGDDLEGAKLYATLDDGTPITLRIDDVKSHYTIYPNDKIYIYTASYQKAGENTWELICGDDADGDPIGAIPLRGRWNYEVGVPDGGSKIKDPDAITFACEGFALYKCAELGYEPWLKFGNKNVLEDHHQACTRMIRADYCGDGESWTVDGTMINVFDVFGIQKDATNWPTEAEWDEDGARCLSHQRIQTMPVVPECSFQKDPAHCGKNIKWQHTLLVSEAL